MSAHVACARLRALGSATKCMLYPLLTASSPCNPDQGALAAMTSSQGQGMGCCYVPCMPPPPFPVPLPCVVSHLAFASYIRNTWMGIRMAIPAFGLAGFQLWGGGGGVNTALWLEETPPDPPKKTQLTPPPNPIETDPPAPEVTWTQNSAKNRNGIFGISALRGFRKIIICDVFGGKN